MRYLKNKWGQAREQQELLVRGEAEDKPTGAAGMLQGSFKDASAEASKGGTGFSAKGYSGTQQGDDPNRQKMRDQYGWKMTDAQFSKLQKDTKLFNKQVNDYRAAYNKDIGIHKAKTTKDIGKMQSDYDKQKTRFSNEVSKTSRELDSAKKSLGKAPTISSYFNQWYNQEKIKVNVISQKTNQVEGSYWVPKETARNFTKGLSNVQWGARGNTVNINTKQHGRTKGNFLHTTLGYKLGNKKWLMGEFKKEPTVSKSYGKAVGQWNSANSRLNKAYDNFNKSRSASASALSQYNTNIKRSQQNLQTSIKSAQISRDTEVGKVTSARQGKIDAAKKAYSERTALRRKAYGNLAKMTTTGDTNET